MTAKRQRKAIARELPPVCTTMTATYKGQAFTAEIVEAKELPAGRGVRYGEEIFSSLSAAGRAVTGHATNGWKFWQPAETSEEQTLREEPGQVPTGQPSGGRRSSGRKT